MGISEATATYNITSYPLGKGGVTVGLVLTTVVGYWIVDGYIDIKYRPRQLQLLESRNSSSDRTGWKHLL